MNESLSSVEGEEAEGPVNITRPVKRAKQEAAEGAAKPVKMYTVTIHSGPDSGTKSDVFLAHNYKSVLIQRDKEVTLNEHFMNVLKDTVIETEVKGPDGVVRHIKIPTYSYTSQAI